jgi:hypothetical protein
MIENAKNIKLKLTLTEDSVYRIYDIIRENVSFLKAELEDFCTCSSCFTGKLIKELGLEAVNTQGKYTKRLKKFFKRHGLPMLNNSIFSQIGKYVSECSENKTYHCVMNDDIQFQAGIFGDIDACFHHGRSYSKALLQQCNAKAFFVFCNGEPVARSWLIPLSEQLGVQNCWASTNLYVADRQSMPKSFHNELVSKFFDIPNAPRMYEVDDGGIYLNDGALRIFGLPEGFDESLGLDSNVDSLEHDKDNYSTCSKCGQLLNITEDHCEFCGARTRYQACQHCGVRCHKPHMNRMDGEYYCPDCSEELFYRCNNCGRLELKDNLVKTTNGLLCERCIAVGYTKCSECGLPTPNNRIYRAKEGFLCRHCYEQQVFYREPTLAPRYTFEWREAV